MKINPKWIIVIPLIVFVITTFYYTWVIASPYLQADDWRFVNIYLRPVYNGDFKISDLWSDGVHPMPLYATLFIWSSKYFHLQVNYIARFSIFFQMFLGLTVGYSFLNSVKTNKINSYFLIMALISINTVIFSFIVHVPYAWPLMTTLFLSSFFTVFLSSIIDRYLKSQENHGIKVFLITGLILIVFFLMFSDWAVIFSLSIITVLSVISLIERKQLNKLLKVIFVLVLSLIIGGVIISFLKENSRNLHVDYTKLMALIIDNPVLFFKTISVGLFSGLVNYKWVVKTLEINQLYYLFFSVVFMIAYVFVLLMFFMKKLYKKSLVPPVLMIYSLIFILSVLVFRYNPVTNGEYCLIIPRYLQYYQVGLAGFFWGTYLLLFNTKSIKLVNKIIIPVIAIILVFFWINDFRLQLKTSGFLISKYPEVSKNIRERINDENIKVPWSIQSYMNVNSQLNFLKTNKLNIYAPNYPYPDTSVKVK